MKNKAEHLEGAIATKKNKAGKMNVLVFEPEGGAPYTVDVQPHDGVITLPGSETSYKVTRGSVWIEGGTARTCINADNPQTINIATLTGADAFHPTMLNTVVANNLAQQVAAIAKQKPIWARGTTWGILGTGLLLGLLMFWLVHTVGGGFEEIRQAIEGIQFSAQEQGSGTGSSGGSSAAQEAAGHNPIAPGGQ